MEDPNVFLNPGYFENHTIFVYLNKERLITIPPPSRYRDKEESYVITKYPEKGAVNQIDKYYIFPKRSVNYIEMEMEGESGS